MSMKKRIIILVVSLIIVTGIIVGVSYAFFSIGGSQETANTFQSGCLNISLTDASASISLSNIYPITDIEGLDGTSYDFTIENTCNTDANYQINLESLNQASNSLSADYIKVSLSSDTVGNVISILSDNTSVTPEIDGAYESYNLYIGTLGANETKTYHLKLWLDYDATVEQAASKTYSSKINVIANPEIQVVDNLEATFALNDKTLTSNLTSNVTSATYCISTDNICTPNTNANISNNSFTVELESKVENQMVCTKFNGTSKLICSEKLEGIQLCPEGAIACNTILTGKDIEEREDFDTPFVNETTGTIYQTTDWKGTSYYFAGNPTDNWVKFGGFYWRIIRINGDGSLRLLYNGTTATTTGEETMISTSQAFNTSYNRSEYVGLKYTEGEQHGQNTNSTILTELDSWYTSSNLDDYAEYIDTNIGFCSDREMASGYTWSSDPSSTIYYAARERIVTNQNPSLACSSNDIIKIPVGLITGDETMFGGVPDSGNATGNYLINGQHYWTMSPHYFNDGYAGMFHVHSNGELSNWSVNNTIGVRPVINLKASIQFSGGIGTVTNPYVVET